jgi:hypothetical protein
MNNLEFKSVEILKNLIDSNGVLGIKTSFEDEGASFFEVMRLKELCNQAGTKLLLKISGAEAKRDLIDSQSIGVKGIVAPMIESGFALDKFIKSVKEKIPASSLKNIQLGINIETITAYKNFNEIINSDGFNSLYHITIGRVDFVNSMNKNRDFVDSDQILDYATHMFTLTKQLGKKNYLGGAITLNSEGFLKFLYGKGLLDKFETRYVIYDPTIALNNLEVSLKEGQRLELGILKYRQDFYYQESIKENDRIQMIEKRLLQNTDNNV